MNIQLRFFASVREALGTANETIDVPAHVLTVGDVQAFLRSRGGVWAEALGADRAVRIACQHEMTAATTPITPGCEVAFFPPVTGG
ncbi:molybdopterin synthase sulfur carrier subunit [Actimicrobium sp. GrIS 1.19]|uniref:molybdopterin converting factor subunit 1 n=1 Tax=Actimicrobium sp. GrIS 1.19 TaxID=3071708 RepID=UPI002DFA9DE0|nr:molybdopterin synthase sulfur carrier subunit [Actimicrobium sp. GrIS 1.19]